MGRSKINILELEKPERNRNQRKKKTNADKPKIESRFMNNNKKSKATDLFFDNRLVRVWSPEVNEEKDIVRNLRGLSKLPDVYPYISIMPDYHIGESSVNGSIIPTRNTLIVNSIGGDIGCGISFSQLPFSQSDLDSNKLERIYKGIYAAVPTGRRFDSRITLSALENPVFNSELGILNGKNKKVAMQQLGSLGGGNHFIEIQADEDGRLGVMIHTGSRGLGQMIRGKFIAQGAEDKRSGAVTLDANEDMGRDYYDHVKLAEQYAVENRNEILERVYQVFCDELGYDPTRGSEDLTRGRIDVGHNHISKEKHFGEDLYVHRKGAVRLEEGELGLIPGSMGTLSYIVRGTGNKYSFSSTSHGAGRVMSRGEAFRKVSRSAFTKAMGGILSRKDDSILDEAPQAYKDINEVLSYQKDLAKVVKKLRPLASIKG